VHTLVPADDLAGLVDERPRALQLGRGFLDERGVVAIGDEADFLTVWLRGDAQRQAFGVLAHGWFVEVTDRKRGPRQLFLRQREQEIGLVLGRVHASS
jgi:hypothetical protein